MVFSVVVAMAPCEGTVTLNCIHQICCDKKSESQSYYVNSPSVKIYCNHYNVHITNKVTNVLATCLSNQVTSSRHITTWHYDAVIVYRNGHYFIKRIT